MKTVSTGMPFLDKALMKGLPTGFTVLVAGTPGSGTELFAKQFAAAVTGDEHIVYFATAERDDEIKATLDDFGWKSELKIVNIGNLYYESVLAKKLEISRYRQEGLGVEDLHKLRVKTKKERSEINFLTSLTYEISKLKPPFRVVIDSLDFFLEYYNHADVLSALRTIKAHTQHEEGVALITMLTNVYDTRTQSGVEEIVDCVIELERIREVDSFKRYLIIRKVRNHPEKTGIYAYTITREGMAPV